MHKILCFVIILVSCVHSDYEYISVIIIIHNSLFNTTLDTFNIIQINPGLLRANLLTENDINNYIKYYSQQTQTSWCVLKSFKSNRYVIR